MLTGVKPMDADDLLAIAVATQMPLSFFDPSRTPRKIAEAVRDTYPDMPPEGVRQIERSAFMVYQGFKGKLSSDQTNEWPFSDTSDTTPKPGGSSSSS
jgi:hypothetical protein